jgi:O-antigen ligase
MQSADPVRGSGSGLTGRTAYWHRGIETLMKQPLIGYGFRTRSSVDEPDPLLASAHSGYINFALDLGLVGAALFILVFVNSLVMRFRQFRIMRDESGSSEDAVVVATLLAVAPSLVVMWQIEPTLLNLGLPMHIVVLFMLFGLSTRAVGARTNRASETPAYASTDMRGAVQPPAPAAQAPLRDWTVRRISTQA